MKLAVVALLAAGCGGDVYTVDVRPKEPLSCQEVPALKGGIQSVGIEVVREVGQGLEQIPGLETCVTFDRTRDVQRMLDAFAEQGSIIEGVPADTWTILRFVGYRGVECLRTTENVCGITCPPVRAGDVPEDGVLANFVCDAEIETAHRKYAGCLNLEALSGEDRAAICQE